MTHSTHDDDMYVAAGALIRDQAQLYEDFGFLQMPYTAVLLGRLYQWSGTRHPFLALKIVGLVFTSIPLLFFCLRRGNGTLFTAAPAFLYAMNLTLQRACDLSISYSAPLCFSLLAYWSLGNGSRTPVLYPARLFVSGVFLALAVGSKFYYAALIPRFLRPPGGSRAGKLPSRNG